MTQTAQVALVTGGSRGIGAAVAKRLATQGFAVAVGYAGRAEAAEAVVAEIAAAGGKAVAVQGDVAEAAEVARLFDTAEAALGPVGVVVNSAGVMSNAPLAEADLAAVDRQIAINFRGCFLVLAEAARRLGPGGRIVTMSTSVVGTKLPAYGIYAATKAAVETMTAILSKELRGKQITVNAIAPGGTKTELFLEGKSPDLLRQLAMASPLERLGEVDDIAAAVGFLAGPDGAWVNGQVLRVNGGTV